MVGDRKQKKERQKLQREVVIQGTIIEMSKLSIFVSMFYYIILINRGCCQEVKKEGKKSAQIFCISRG